MRVTRFHLTHRTGNMAALTVLVISWLFVVATVGRPSDLGNTPKWAPSYTVSGVLRLPYAEIVEPFQAWYDSSNKRSRIDYYGGMDVTIQRGDVLQYGANFRICPETTETETNVRKCFQRNGTTDGHVQAQSVLPDMTQFKYIGNQTFGEQDCDVWQYVTTEGYKVNTYTMYIASDVPSPVHYEMLGFDSLLGSHYDKYEVDYINYDTDVPPPSVFGIPEGLKCTGFPGPGAQTSLIANPMQEFVEPYGMEKVDQAFEEFLHKHPKDYANYVDRTEHGHRSSVFKQNLRFIHSKNRQNLSYRLAVNHLADRTDREIRLLRGRRTSKGYNGGQPFEPDLYKMKDIPDSINWRLRGAVTPVKDQAVCGSCWSFGTTGAIEGALFLKTKQLVRLSQQNLIDCSWGFGNNGCDGGEEFRSYQWIMKHSGIATEQSYGQYLAQDGYCHFKDATVGAKISSYVNVTSGDQEALKIAIAQKGPVSVGIDASHKSFSFYSFGVYYEPQCGNKPDDLDHAVLAVGYGTLNGQDYWLVKNSWSTHWGNDGYVLMSQKDNNCGVATDATFVIIE